jgi:IclR family KDG regulon transcriptional repressor
MIPISESPTAVKTEEIDTPKATAMAKKADNSEKSGQERGGIQSIERAFGILEQITMHRDGITLAELCKNVGLHSSTAFHLVKTMVQLGYASQSTDSKKYRIGRKVLSLASGARDENELAHRALPILEVLTEKTGESSHFAIRSGYDAIIVAKTGSAGMFQLVDRPGVLRPSHATAIGKVLLAAMAPAQVAQYFSKRELTRFTAKTIVEHEAFMAELDQVRRDGIAFDDGELDAEVRCVAVPVHDYAGRTAGALGISGPMWRLSLHALNDKAKIVRESATEMSAELGHPGESAIQH